MKNRELAEKTTKHIKNLFLPWVLGDPANITHSKGGTTYAYPPELISDLTELCQLLNDLAVMLRAEYGQVHLRTHRRGTEVRSQEEDSSKSKT